MTAKTKIDSIIRQVLLEKGLPVHFYIRLLSWGLDCLKELELDHIGTVKTAELTVDEFARIKLPCDYVDWVRVGQVEGQNVLPMGETRSFARQLKTVDGTYVPYTDSEQTASYFWSSYYVQDWLDKNGEFRGRGFGGNGTRTDTFMVLDDVMQLNNNYAAGDVIVLDYISYDPLNASSYVHKYAEGAIRTYMEYKYLCSLPKSNPYDKNMAMKMYENEHRKLVARISPMDIEEIGRIKHRHFKQTAKF